MARKYLVMTATSAPDKNAHQGPTFGFTKHGRAVYPNTFDHLPSQTPYARFNKRLAVLITSNVGTIGQNLQNIAADARSAKTVEDVERIIDLLDCRTQGGLQLILEAIDELKAQPSGAGEAG